MVGYVGSISIADLLIVVIGFPLLGALTALYLDCSTHNDWPWSIKD